MALLQEERDNFINDINLQQILYSPHVGPSSNIILNTAQGCGDELILPITH